MSKRIVTVTAPNGAILTRQTDNPYTHAVLVEKSNAELSALALKSVGYNERYLAELEAMQPDHSQYSCRDNNIWHVTKRLADSKAEFAAQSTEGTTWFSYSFHKTEAAAQKQALKIIGYGYVAVKVVGVNA